jgi:large subunit ribosomal protein L21
MFAVVETGGKQYKVSPGQTFEVEKLPAEPGDTVELGRVLLISTDDQTLIGAPLVEDAKVVTRVAQVKRGPKLIIFRYKSKSRYRRKTGHRQDYTVLTIEDIWANGASLLPAKEEAETEPEAEVEETAAAEVEEVEEAEAEEAEEAEAVEEAEAEATPEAKAAETKPAPEASEEQPKRGRRARKGNEE